MSEPNWILEADPKRPYKMYAAMLSAFLTSLLASGLLPAWAAALITALVAGLAVYIIGNPLRVKKSPSERVARDEPLF